MIKTLKNNLFKDRARTQLVGGLLLACLLLGATYAVSTGFLGGADTMVQNSDERLATQGAKGDDMTTDLQTLPEFTAAVRTAISTVTAKNCYLYSSLARDGADYIISITNTGGKPCRNVAFSIFYAAEETYESSSPAPSVGDYNWRIGDLKAGQKVTRRVTVSGEGPGTEICATADNSADACATLQAPSASMPVVGGIIAPVATPTAAPTATPTAGEEYGVWVWDSPYTMSAAGRTDVIQKAKNAGFTVIYITIDDYLTIDASRKSTYMAAMASFTAEAAKAGIKVDAVGGGRDWAKPANRWKGYTLINFVGEFNRTYANPIRGLQYDVEPYLLPEYETNKAQVLTEFVSFVDESNTRMKSVNARFALVIPHFYDSAQNWTPAITYGGQTAHTFDHLLRILDTRTNSTIIIMSYRNFAHGDNGSIQISLAEISQAAGHSTKVIVGQETGNEEPAYVTFFGLSKTEFYEQLKAIRGTFVGSAGYGGVAVHHLAPFMQLR